MIDSGIVWIRLFLITLLLGQVHLNRAQTQQRVEILRSSAQINTGCARIDSVKRVSLNGDYDLHATLWNDQEILLSRDSLWGYKSNGKIYRYYPNRGYMLMEDLGGLLFYPGSKSHAWFSRTSDSRQYELTRINIRKAYSSDKELLTALSAAFKWYEYYSAHEINGNYDFVKVYKAVHPKQ
ncbi:MAG: hypothetical protein ACHQRM_07115 [Bacteroidia bacterium]